MRAWASTCSVDDDEVFIQQYVGFTTELELGGSTVTLSLSGDYAIEGKSSAAKPPSQSSWPSASRLVPRLEPGAPASDSYLTSLRRLEQLDLDFVGQFLAAGRKSAPIAVSPPCAAAP